MKKWIYVLLAAVFLTACGQNTENDREAVYLNITAQEAKKIMDTQEGYVILDTRTQEEYDGGHIPGAILIPSTGGATGMTPEERLQPTELMPEMATLDCGTCNFGDDIFVNDMPTLRAFGKRMIENGIKPEYECFEIGHLDTALTMAAKGEIPGHPMQFNFVLGVSGCAPATVENLAFMVSKIPYGSTWTVTGVGRGAWPMAAAGIIMGGHVRVGFEDNIYLARGHKAASNGELVEKVVRLAKELGREIATPADARRILGLKPIE